MILSRPFSLLVVVSLALLAVPSLTGCGSANRETVSDPSTSEQSSDQDSVAPNLATAPFADATPQNEEARHTETAAPAPVVPEAAPLPQPLGIRVSETAERGETIPSAPFTPRATSISQSPSLQPEAAAALPGRTAPKAMALAPAAPSASPQNLSAGSAPAPTATILKPATETAVPRMATRSLETAAPETKTALDPAPASESSAATPTAIAAREPVAEDRGDYEAVTVFYGTDRSSTATSGQPEQPHRLYLYAAGVCLLLFGLFVVVALASARKKTFTAFAILAGSSGCVLSVLGTIAWLQSDRAVAGPKLEYGNDRGDFVIGACEVSIPRNHEVAELEAPSVYKLDFVEDPTRHVALLNVEEEDSETFFSQLRKRVDDSPVKDAFVFVHGFNVTFEDAARRTAQLAYDLRFQGAPIFYSWPSQGGLFQYTIDETNVVWTVPHLKQFLKDIAERSGARSVHLIAHSMGNRALTSALRELAPELDPASPPFHEVVLTAPDIDADVFRRDIAPAIVGTARRVTLYASSNDEALVLSKQVHGYARAGDSGDGLVVIKGIETVDVSAVDTSLLGHNYYGDNATVISDMIDLVRNSKSARERSWLETAHLDDLLYWVFRGDRQTADAATSSTSTRY